jgi:CheY-like chemotaxis protein
MSPDIIRRATDPFFTTKEVGKGTGLGLSMVKGLVEHAGGKLQIHSVLGEGSLFELWFPVARAEGRLAAEATAPSAQPIVGPHLILAVDDDPLVLLNTAFMLEDLGHTVLQATSGAEALAILEDGAGVDLVITDQIMPKMTGLQLANAIWTRWPQLPVILATGFAELPEESPDVTRLAKPFMQADLVRVLGAALARNVGAI